MNISTLAASSGYVRPVQPAPPVQSAPHDSDGDNDGDTGAVKAATPAGVGGNLDITA